MRTRLACIAAVAALAAACGGSASAAPARPAAPPTADTRTDLIVYDGHNSGTSFNEVTVRLRDGRTVTCVVMDYRALSCDWIAK